MAAKSFREKCRQGIHTGPTCGHRDGHAQANLVVLPREPARHFREFCHSNPKPCPLLEVVDGPLVRDVAPGADLRTDLPRYRVYRRGILSEEVTDISHLWKPELELVAFLLGCSFSFEEALAKAGLPLRHVEEGRNVPMYRTDRPCQPAGPFRGPLVVSMRPMPEDQVDRAREITRRYPRVHGSPIHAGDPGAIGVSDLSAPLFGDAVTVHPNEVPVFWACGATPQAVVMESKPELCITHAPGHMLVLDVLNEDLAATDEREIAP